MHWLSAMRHLVQRMVISFLVLTATNDVIEICTKLTPTGSFLLSDCVRARGAKLNARLRQPHAAPVLAFAKCLCLVSTRCTGCCATRLSMVDDFLCTRLPPPLKTDESDVSKRWDSFCATRLSMVGDFLCTRLLPFPLKTDDVIVLEAENFSLGSSADNCWRPLPWGENAYASTFLAGGSTFLSRKAFLGAPAGDLGISKGRRCVASASGTIAVAGVYAPLVRFEALCRRPACFETQFEVAVLQAGVVKFRSVFGATYGPGSLDLTGGPSAPAGGTGVVRNKLITNAITWQGAYNRTLPLSVGEVTVELAVSHELTPPNSGPRNIDVVVLTRDFADLAVRLAHGGQHGNTPLDGMLTQEGDVFLRLRNHADGVQMSLNVPFAVEHSNYWSHLRFPSSNGTNDIPPLVLRAAPGTVGGWQESGSRLDSLNDGEWNLQAAAQNATLRHSLHYTVDVGVLTAGDSGVTTVASFDVRGCPYFEPSGQTPCKTKLDYDVCHQAPLGPIIRDACPLALAYDSNTRATKRIRRAEEQLEDVMRRVRRHLPFLPTSGRPPNSSQVLVSCTNCFVNSSNLGTRWNASATEFRRLYGIQVQHEDDLDSPSSAGCDGTPFAYRSLGPVNRAVCWTGIYANASQCLDAQLAALSPAAKDCVAVVSLGDEISIPPILSVPGGAVEATALYVSWAQRKKLTPLELGCASANWSSCHWDASAEAKRSNPSGYYFSSIWSYDWAALQMRQFTERVAAHLPNAAVGANFAAADFCSQSWKWIDVFRASALTMPWAEGYTFAFDGPLLGTPQMVELRQEMLRSGVSRLKEGLAPGRLHGQMLFYVTNQWPGQAPKAWKRQLYAALAHHVKGIDLYEMHSSLGALENYIGEYPDELGTYEVILSSMWELGQIDDIVAASPSQRAPAGEVALYFSTAADAWGDNDAYGEWGTTVFGCAKRALYILLRHQQLRIDILNEEDLTDTPPRLSNYRVLYVTDAHVSTMASIAIGEWVRRGGTMFATAGAGMYNEFNQSNSHLREALGLSVSIDYPILFASTPISFLKLDLPTAEPLDHVVLAMGSTSGASIAAYGARAMLGNNTLAETVLARFASDNGVAATAHIVGQGRAVLVAFLPSISWFKSALPSRPIDICARDDPLTGCFSQFLPHDFDSTVANLITPTVAELPEQLAITSEALVEVSVLNAHERGAAILLINWSMGPRVGLNISVAASYLPLFATAIRVSDGEAVPFHRERVPGGLPRWIFAVDQLEVADAVALRR